jgi:hypothetical protein
MIDHRYIDLALKIIDLEDSDFTQNSKSIENLSRKAYELELFDKIDLPESLSRFFEDYDVRRADAHYAKRQIEEISKLIEFSRRSQA